MQEQVETFGILIFKGIVLPVVGLLITWASLRLPSWIKAKVKNESVAGVLERLTTLAFAVVQEVQQTVVSNLENPTIEQLKLARDKAIESLKSHLGPKGVAEIRTVLGLEGDSAVDRLLVTFIESAVHSLKHAPQPGQLLEMSTTTATPDATTTTTATTTTDVKA